MLQVLTFFEFNGITDGDGRLIGKDATSFLAMSNLPREDLKQVLLSVHNSFQTSPSFLRCFFDYV